MPEINHPAAPAERAHLAETLAVIRAEQRRAADDQKVTEKALAEARRFDPDALPVREMLYTRAVQTVHNLARAAETPYFTRIDFTEKGGAPGTYYIGKYGVLRSDTLEAEVVDWRAPAANLYYSGQIGPMKYESPGGVIEGELTLKRQFGIEGGELRSIFDADLVTQERFLQDALSAASGDRLREIVTTIQAEQNYVIRYPLNRTLVVQGVAGSGKTTIALHRIAYLLYTYQDRLRPEQMVILAPNPLFLNYIAQVLPDLGVERVRQTTFARLIGDWLGEALPPLDLADRLERVYAMPPAELDAYARALKYKGSPELERRLETWLDAFEAGFVPEDGLAFGPVPVYTAAELRQFLLVDEKPFPLARRLAELQKQLRPRAEWAANAVCEWYQQETRRRAARLREAVADPAERDRRLRRLEENLLERQKQTRAQARRYARDALAAFPDLDPVGLYARFWREQLAAGAAGDARLAAEHTLARLDAGLPLEREDIAPIALIALRVRELKRQDIRHVVIDEAQDFSPLEVSLLRRLARGASFTIVGDLMQGISGYRGLDDWRALTDGVFAGQAARHDLLTSYRSTTEIMRLALRVWRNHPLPGQAEAKPVLRHGEAPRLVRVADAAERLAEIRTRLRRWRREGGMGGTIAVIARERALLAALEPALREEFAARMLDPDDESYAGGVLLAPADSVKGLEFDGVILAEANAAAFPERDLDARLLYVCLTRALHRLDVLYTGEATGLLK